MKAEGGTIPNRTKVLIFSTSMDHLSLHIFLQGFIRDLGENQNIKIVK